MTSTPGDTARLEVQHHATSPARLTQIALERPDLWGQILDHPHCDPATRQWILSETGALRPAAPDAALARAARARPQRATARRRRGQAVIATLAVLVLLGALGATGIFLLRPSLIAAGPDTEPAVESSQLQKEAARAVEQPVEEDEAVTEDPADPAETSSDASGDPDTDVEDDPDGDSESAAVQEDDGDVTDRDAPEPWTDPDAEAPEPSPAAAPPVLASEEPILLQSPSGNIGCEITTSYAGCTIASRDENIVGCPSERTASVAVYPSEPAMSSCSVQYLGTDSSINPVITLEYGTTISERGFTCMSETDGFTCWSDASGYGFKVGRKLLYFY